MFFWIREGAGWLLVALSLYMIWIGLGYITNLQEPKIIEASIINIAALGILKAGTMLIRISTTSRIAMQLVKPTRAESNSLAERGAN